MSTRDVVLVLVMGLAVAHVTLLGWWVVDDAAISFAYARSLASGQGLTPYVGGEQVEGYSNATWVLLLAIGQRIGAGPFFTAKALSFVLIAATVPLVHALASRVDRAAGLPAAALFAANTQVAVFGAAGLENPLLAFLLALGLWLVAREIEEGAAPWSALVFAVVGATRPEGLIYAAAVAPWMFWGRSGVRWLGVVVPLSVGYQLARYAWFAWPFPMTYYAKVQVGPEAMVRWQGAGWQYLRGFLLGVERVWMLPIVLVGALGPARWRLVAGTLIAVMVIGMLPSAVRWLGPPAAIALLGLAATLTLPVGRTGGWAVRGPCWTTGLAAAVFAVQTGGDWMAGYRWLAIAAVPGAVLGALGLVELAAAMPRQIGIGAVTSAIAAFAGMNVAATIDYRADPETSVFMVGGRVRSTRNILARLHLEERPVCMTLDIGGFLWWSGMEIVDTMGLVDVPVAMNKNRGAVFWAEYLDERRPHLLFRIGGQAGGDLSDGRVLAERYIEAARWTLIRRDLVFEPTWSGSADEVIASDGLFLVGVDVRQPTVAAGDRVRVDLGLRSTGGRSFTSELVLADPGDTLLAAWPVEPAYGLMAPALWRADEVFHGRYTIVLPRDLPLGSYRLGVRLDGVVVWPGEQIEVVDAGAARAAAIEARKRALALATSGRCEEADRAGLVDPEGRRARASCWLERSDGDPIARIERARRIDPDLPGLARARPLADERFAAGLHAREAGDAEGSFRAFTDVLRLDPGRPRARRYAEEARTLRSGQTVGR